jgi:hypothetical protein
MPSMNHRVTLDVHSKNKCILFPQCHHARGHKCSLHHGASFSSLRYLLCESITQ